LPSPLTKTIFLIQSQVPVPMTLSPDGDIKRVQSLEPVLLARPRFEHHCALNEELEWNAHLRNHQKNMYVLQTFSSASTVYPCPEGRVREEFIICPTAGSMALKVSQCRSPTFHDSGRIARYGVTMVSDAIAFVGWRSMNAEPLIMNKQNQRRGIDHVLKRATQACSHRPDGSPLHRKACYWPFAGNFVEASISGTLDRPSSSCFDKPCISRSVQRPRRETERDGNVDVQSPGPGQTVQNLQMRLIHIALSISQEHSL